MKFIRFVLKISDFHLSLCLAVCVCLCVHFNDDIKIIFLSLHTSTFATACVCACVPRYKFSKLHIWSKIENELVDFSKKFDDNDYSILHTYYSIHI